MSQIISIIERSKNMIYSQEVENMCPVAQGVHHGCAPIPEEAKWVKAKEVKDISGFTHGVGWCAPSRVRANLLSMLRKVLYRKL